jgi:molybdate transport system substrate-binding protein
MRPLILNFLMVLVALPAWASGGSRYEPRANLTILADESLMLPLARLTRDYATRTRTPLTVVIKNPQDAEKQIEQGLEAHVIITADYPLLGRLTEQGLTDVSSRHSIARTGLALVATHDVKKTLNIAERFSFAAILKATGDAPIFSNAPLTLDGARVEALKKNADFAETLNARLSIKPNAEDVITALRDEGGVALLLATASLNEPDIKLLSILPEDISPSVTYDAVVLGSELMDEAKDFTSYLASREAQAIFAHFGYQVPKQ